MSRSRARAWLPFDSDLFCSPQFMNSVRLWDFIEEREQSSAPPLQAFADDITELRELFVQMSGPSPEEEEEEAASSSDP